ncbi:Na-translocating system protein MpsC family protein [Planomicrobium sp. CPCC 101079]|uniref:Na-translocating system protein MpsC family protein n=1 Tax=Planomicrobium sp. CPCC 101079 TaxID=2599618 RepID=UPI0011B489CD|nr:Na-translocating system protein MpsC family protein [Planomicrobium sp. CPCC 101079]TWT09258.1 DUF2294 family protein [Planomicrobium sp. CPCC 101079]
MVKEQLLAEEIVHFISQQLIEEFGASISSVDTIIQKPFIIIHLLDFSFPTEETFFRRKELEQIMRTRDLIMEGWKGDIRKKLTAIVGAAVEEVYVDWNLENRTGMLIAIMEEKDKKDKKDRTMWQENEEKRKLKEKVLYISRKTEKTPDEIEIYRLNDYILLIERLGIMVDIEKELVKNGAVKELRVAKRPLEHRLMDSLNEESVLEKKVGELFVDWDFAKDKAFMVLVLEK